MAAYITLSLFVAIVGAIMWGFIDPAKYPKLVEAGKVFFWTGTLAYLLTVPGAFGFHVGRSSNLERSTTINAEKENYPNWRIQRSYRFVRHS